MFARRGDGLGNHGEQQFDGAEQLEAMAWVAIWCRLCGEIVSSVDAP
jgi:hypothetical protein